MGRVLCGIHCGSPEFHYCKDSSCRYRYLQKTTSRVGGLQNIRDTPSSTESSRKDSEDEVAELAGAHHPYRFELEGTSF